MNYKKIYEDIVTKAKNEQRAKNGSNVYELHHILPKSLGGSNETDNLVLLTPREHYICHMLLVDIYPESKQMKYAFWIMSHPSFCNKYIKERTYKVSARAYERARRIFSEVMRVAASNRIKTEEEREKISLKLKGKKRTTPVSEETRRKLSEALKGVHTGKKRSVDSIERGKATLAAKREIDPLYGLRRSPEAVERISAVHKKRITCPHCSKEIQFTTKDRYHFDNCALNPNRETPYYNPIVKCTYCSKSGKSTYMQKYHFDNCRKNKNRTPKEMTSCPHCGKEGKIGGNMKRYHFDNCKFKK